MSDFRDRWRKAVSAKNAKQRSQKGRYRKRDPFRAMTHVVRRPEGKSREDATEESSQAADQGTSEGTTGSPPQ